MDFNILILLACIIIADALWMVVKVKKTVDYATSMPDSLNEFMRSFLRK